ncbi:aminotransferase class V-fold PLP-dependent enzyme [Hallella bergensis]|uniref:aminotransferase class V-fold PLP-dependent enzyme n=1 Tax=Hallella bergensis TaxID=242750 RepID=UPI003990B3B6
MNCPRSSFPILSRTIYGKPLVYLDNAATTQKPLVVLDAMREEYLNVNANVHRGVHWMSQQATELHEQARETVRRFLHAGSTNEIVFTRGTTEGINLVASSFCEAFMHEGDEIILSTMEHHSNIVPWQLQAERKGLTIKVIPMTDDGTLDMEAYANLFTERTRIVSVAHVSNVLGTVNPVAEMIRIAHEHHVPVLIDGAQSAPHFRVDVQALDCDFFVFSGHKVYGPTGIGVLYGKEDWLDKLPPYQGGGEMIAHVSFEKTTFERPPLKFEAGTPDYVATHGLAKALDYVTDLGLDNIARHEKELTKYALTQLRNIEGIKIYGHPSSSDEVGEAVISFNVGNIHHMDLGTLLDRLGIAVRTGHHCAQPLMDRLGVLGTVRASFALYNTLEEVDAFIDGLERVVNMF